MKKYAILLRGVTPTGKNRVPMADLRAALSVTGLLDVQTYIQSGNVIAKSALAQSSLESLVKAAQQSVGLKEGQRGILFEMRHLLSELDLLEGFINQLEREMACTLHQIPYSRSLFSLKGIGKITAAGLIGEVGDLRKFSTFSDVEKLAGLNLFEISSGKFKGKRHISKRGRPLLRKLLFFAAINTVRKGGGCMLPTGGISNGGCPRSRPWWPFRGGF